MLAQPTVESKYKAKVVYWNLVTRTVVSTQSMEQYRVNGRMQIPQCIARFDSQHEFKVYLELVRMYGADCILRQYPVEIVPECYCYPKGKKWKVDFGITGSFDETEPMFHVEAKGAFLPEFATTLVLLEMTDPAMFDNLFIIFGSKMPSDSLPLRNLLRGEFKQNLLTLPQLKDLSRLI
jgi:hypothetical protein